MESKKKNSTYNVNVLGTNNNLKAELASFGACRSILLTLAKSINLPTSYSKLLRDSKDNKALYEVLDKATRRSKKGKVSPFYVLQMLHKVTEGRNAEYNALIEGLNKPTIKRKAVVKAATATELNA